MNKDKWTQQLHDKLADREVSAPEGLWADIEAALPKTPVKKERRSLLIPLRRWAIAASLAILVAGGGYIWWQGNPEKPLLSQNPEKPTIPEKPNIPENTENTEGFGTTEISKTSEHSGQSEYSKKSDYSEQSEFFEKPQTQPEQILQPEPIRQPEQTSQPVTETPKEELHEEQSLDETIRQLDTQIASLTPKQGRMTVVSLYASNGLTDLQSANGVRMSDEMAAHYDMSSYLPASTASAARTRATRTRAASEIIYLSGYEERQKHAQPISVGLSVGYPLSSKLSLSTGVVYTRLRSDFTSIMNDLSISRQQTLHYLGIPLNAQYHFWHSGHLNVYFSAGGEADYNIKARMVSCGVEQQMHRDRWQFSLQGGVGIQYDVLPQLGLYAEPGAKYYFDNGSAINNFFKDNPLNFNLQVGLRLNIK